MYVTRRLLDYQKDPSQLTLFPPEGPNSGILVIQDEDSQPTCCFGLCFGFELRGLPFPQNRKLTVRYTTGHGEHRRVERDPVVFIPVLDHPLSSNWYYAIKRSGKHRGEACKSAKEEDRTTCCLCFSYVPNAKPQPPNPNDMYQQFEICPRRSSSSRYFFAKSVAQDGVPPRFLKRKGWTVGYSASREFDLTDDAKGIDTKLRFKHPDHLTSTILIGKWYVPFIFVKEGDVKAQMKISMYYSMTLEQRWEEIFSCKNIYNEDGDVSVDVDVETKVIKVDGKTIASESKSVDGDGVEWLRVIGNGERQEKKIGLGSVVIERMNWEEERFGWANGGGGRAVKVKKAEKFGGGKDWKSYGCYMLVERFVLRRNDGNVVLTYEYKHTDKLRNKWD